MFVNGGFTPGNISGSSNIVATPPRNHVAGNDLVGFVAFADPNGNITVNRAYDLAGNVFTVGQPCWHAGTKSCPVRAKIINGSAVNVVTFELSAPTTARSAMIEQYSDLDQNAPLVLEVTPSSGGPGTLLTSNQFPTPADCTIVAMGTGVNNWLPGSGYAMRDNGSYAACQDKSVSAIQTNVTASMTQGGSFNWNMHVMVFKNAAGGGGGTKYTRIDGIAPSHHQSVMVLVPNANSANPYVGAPTTLVMYHHGSGEDQTALLSDPLKAAVVIAFADAGFIMAGTAAQSTTNWGIQAAVDDYADLYKFIVNAGYNIGKVVVWGQSMGGLTALSTLIQGKVPNVVAFLGTYPACSLAAEYSNFGSAINASYGITGSGDATYANKTFGSDPLLFPVAAFKGVWARFYASPGDTVVPKASNSDALAALLAWGASPEDAVVVCSGNHGDPSHFQPADYVAFIERAIA